MRAALFLAAVALCCGSVRAELLWEVNRQGFCVIGNCEPRDTTFGLGFDNMTGGPDAEFFVAAGPDDEGMEFFAPTDVLAVLETNLTWPIFGGLIGGTFAFDDARLLTSSNLMETNPIQGTIRYAPVLGPNIFGYDITGVSLTVNRLDYIQVGCCDWRGQAEYSFRVYGQVVPEPSGLLLVGIGLVVAHLLRIRRTWR